MKPAVIRLRRRLSASASIAVLSVMAAAPAGLLRAQWERAIAERFGPGARFHTCSASNLTAGELIDFLSVRGKFFPAADGRLSVDSKNICGHE